jgi:hypothetical protein
MKQRGWWRRNLWGLIGLVPAVAALLALSAENAYYGAWSQSPRTPVAADADGRYTMQGAHIRLVDLAEASDLKTYSGAAFVPPGNVKIWRARIEFEADSEAGIGGCGVFVEAADGRLYEDDPREIRGAAKAISSGCLIPSEAKGTTTYVNEVFFALPGDARPVAVRLTDARQLPRYVRLTPR